MKNRIDDLIKKGLTDKEGFEKDLDNLAKKAGSNPGFKKQIRKEFLDSLNRKGREIEELSIRIQLEDISEIISLSYVARRYFSKSRQWFMQRINGYEVNGKKAKFTDRQLEPLNIALQDISKRIGSVSVIH